MPHTFQHLIADFHGVPAAQLRDDRLLSGLVIAAAGAAGFGALDVPAVRLLPHGGVAGLLLLDGCHIAVHTFPEQGLLFLDILAQDTYDPRKALDVFTRRLTAREIRSDSRTRG